MMRTRHTVNKEGGRQRSTMGIQPGEDFSEGEVCNFLCQ